MRKRSSGRNLPSPPLSSVARRKFISGTISRGSTLGVLAAFRARGADGPDENDAPPGEGEGTLVSSAAIIGDEPPQKRTKTAAADADIVEKVRFHPFSVISGVILNPNMHTAGHRLFWTADRDIQTHIFAAKGSPCVPGVIQIQRGLLSGSTQTDEDVFISMISSCDKSYHLLVQSNIGSVEEQPDVDRDMFLSARYDDILKFIKLV